MATKAELIFSVKELLKEHTDDSLLSDDHIGFQVNAYRSMFLRQLYSDRSKSFDEAAKQTLCVTMAPTKSGTCGIDIGCTILRSVERIPGLLSVKGRPALTRVGPPIIGSESYELVNSTQASMCIDDQYAGNVAFIMDGYIYLTGASPAVKLIKCLSITGIFDDPTDLEDFKIYETCGSITTEQCYVEDVSEYPIPGHMISQIILQIVKDFKGVEALEQTRDINNDGVPG